MHGVEAVDLRDIVLDADLVLQHEAHVRRFKALGLTPMDYISWKLNAEADPASAEGTN